MTSSDGEASDAGTPSQGDQWSLRVTALLQRISLGDRESFTELYDEIAPHVFGVAHRLVRHRELAEEVTQDVFVWLWRNAHVFDARRGPALALIHTVTRRRAVDAIRREAAARRRTSPYLDKFDLQIDPFTAVEDEDEVAGLMAGLTQLQRQAVRLHYWEGLDNRELADRLGTNVATAKTRKRDGVMRMRLALRAP